MRPIRARVMATHHTKMKPFPVLAHLEHSVLLQTTEHYDQQISVSPQNKPMLIFKANTVFCGIKLMHRRFIQWPQHDLLCIARIMALSQSLMYNVNRTLGGRYSNSGRHTGPGYTALSMRVTSSPILQTECPSCFTLIAIYVLGPGFGVANVTAISTEKRP